MGSRALTVWSSAAPGTVWTAAARGSCWRSAPPCLSAPDAANLSSQKPTVNLDLRLWRNACSQLQRCRGMRRAKYVQAANKT